MNDQFEIVSTDSVQISRFQVTIDQLQLKDCRQEYSYINIRPGVCVLPIYQGRVVCIHQYRFPVRSWEYEFPGGFIDDGETPQEAAARELWEETGLTAEALVSLGYFYPSFGSTNEKIHLFMAHCSACGEARREPAEFISIESFPVKAFDEMVKNGIFRHGAGLAVWARCKGTQLEKK